jgi:hypothetical protein
MAELFLIPFTRLARSAQASADFLTISGGFALEVILTHQTKKIKKINNCQTAVANNVPKM